MAQYYDGTKLLSLSDINGNKPEIYICTSNRTAGKTTYWSRYVVNKYLKGEGLFCLVYRFNYELDDCHLKFFDDINSLFFPQYTMTSRKICQGMICELFLNDKLCGYAVALNNADQIKKYSHIFNKVERMIFDEFQSETNHYCTDEVKKFISVHTSIARGQGKQVRYVPVFMIGNTVTLLNPYYTNMNISNRLRADTVYLKGDGFVLEQGFNESASKSQQESGFNKAFAGNDYVAYSSQGVYLNDNYSFVETPKGKSLYVATLRYNGKDYAIREFVNDGVVYCDDRADITNLNRIVITTDDHQVNYVMLKKQDWFIKRMKYYFDNGCFRFKNLNCKEAILKMLSY